MAESPPRSDSPDWTSGEGADEAQVIEEAGASAPAPWGRARPWWSAESGGGTGPHALVGGTGPQTVPAPRDGAAPYPPHGTGPHPVHGSGAHPVHGSGAHRVVGGTGPHVAVGGGTGPIPAAPGARPAAPRPRLRRVLLGGGAAAVAVLALTAGALALRPGDGGDGGDGKDARTAAVPASGKVIDARAVAGGLRRDGRMPPQASAAYPFIAGAVRAGGVPAAARGVAVYTGEPGRKVNVLFMGGTGAVGDPAGFLRKARPTTFIQGEDADPGGTGGRAVCGTFAVLTETHLYCAWATEDSYGFVASNRPALSPRFPLMADVMHRIRRDVERPR